MAQINSLPNPFVYLKTEGNIVSYWINGCNTGSFTKKDCQYLIRKLCRNQCYDAKTRNILLNELKALKRPY